MTVLLGSVGAAMKFCSNCGQRVSLEVPPGDNRSRYCCASCGAIHYQNPNMVLGTIPAFGERVLLCRRAIEPRYGYWTLPAGFMENDETIAEGAMRETSEETGANVELGELYSVIDVPHVHQVHIFFRARMIDQQLDPGTETLEARLFAESEIPWEQLAFRTVEYTLRRYFEDRRAGVFGTHVAAIRHRTRPGQS